MRNAAILSALNKWAQESLEILVAISTTQEAALLEVREGEFAGVADV